MVVNVEASSHGSVKVDFFHFVKSVINHPEIILE
jgi:hypothetical protein